MKRIRVVEDDNTFKADKKGISASSLFIFFPLLPRMLCENSYRTISTLGMS